MATSGPDFSIAIRHDGTLWGWGNSSRLAGHGDNQAERTPIQLGSESWAFVEAGPEHVLAISGDGTLWGWGSNLAGQLGLGFTSDKELNMVQVNMGTDWIKVSASGHNLAIKMDSSLWTWGDNNYKYVLDTLAHDITLPVQIHKDRKWVDAAAGFTHSVALDDEGNIWTWGHNDFGQLGTGEFQDTIISTPTKIHGITDVVQIEAGFNFTLVLKKDGTIWSWGTNWYGQLGQGLLDYDDRDKPTQIGHKTNWTKIRAAGFSSFAINEDKELYAWGYNKKGNLGISTNISTGKPSLVSYMEHWIDVAPANAFPIDNFIFGEHTIGIRELSTNLCSTGTNNTGQLGNNNEFSRLRFECDVMAQPSHTTTKPGVFRLGISPNPGPGIFRVFWEPSSIFFLDIILLDLNGRIVFSGRVDRSKTLDLSTLQPGMYIVMFRLDDKSYFQKILIS